ncbi:MAG: class I SAM-dependent methyltransferase [Thermoanaerobaculia bacterium]|jgi:ubiquinone/menaquinone biosynthesis C-methylase UbiE
MDAKQHWENIYSTKQSTEVSWFQAEAHLSQELIQLVAPDRSAAILDVGGGASTLVDGLLNAGYLRVTVLDLAAAALDQARRRLGSAAAKASWLEGNVLDIALPDAGFDVWHDRAVFHFLTDASDRQRYVDRVKHSVRPGGHVLVATFAEDGPTRCSGLEVARYSPEALHAEFGDSFKMLSSTREQHVTPSGATQRFVYCLCRY